MPRRPETGSAVNATPEASASTMRWTMTAGRGAGSGEPTLSAIRCTRSLAAAFQTSCTRAATPSGGT
jgi:hypothetical protein